MVVKLCGRPGCESVQPCAEHRVQAQATRRKDRFYDSVEWRRHRRAYLAFHRSCEMGCGRASVIVDHRERRPRGAPFDPERWDREANLQALCRSCDGSKSARYDGHFGNRLRAVDGQPG